MADWGLRAIGALLALAVGVPVAAIVIGRVLVEEPPGGPLGSFVDGAAIGGRPLRWLGTDRVLFETGLGVAVLTVDGEIPLNADLTTEFGWAESPGGTEAAYAVWEGPGSALYVGPVRADSPPRLLARSEKPEDLIDHVMWTEDGRYVTFTFSNEQLLVPREGGEARPYVPESVVRASATVEVPPGGPFADYVVSHPTNEFNPDYAELEPGRSFGRWTVSPSGGQLEADAALHDEVCRLLLASPDGRFVACSHSTINRTTGASESRAAIVLIRPGS
jgi:hypothetical protein